jgi:hypothetical protein
MKTDPIAFSPLWRIFRGSRGDFSIVSQLLSLDARRV